MKTPKQLRIRKREYEALLAVREGLATKQLKHIRGKWADRPKGCRFNMNDISDPNGSCGSIACIGGWMAAFMAEGFFDKAAAEKNHNIMHDYVWGIGDSGPDGIKRSDPLKYLFFPHPIDFDEWGKITEAEAVMAIDQFLATGKVDWAEICPRLKCASYVAGDEDYES